MSTEETLRSQLEQLHQELATLKHQNAELEKSLPYQSLDQTDQAVAELDSEAELRALVEAIGDTIMVFDQQGRYLKHQQPNPALTYKPLVHRVGKTVQDILPKPEATLFLETIQRTLFIQHSIHVEYQLPLSGHKRWFLGTVSPFLEDKVLWIERDIQALKQAEADLAKANQEISLLNERLKAENLRMSTELEITRHLQQMILPKDEELNAISGLDIAGFMEPADEVGGDYYDVLQYQGKVKIGIGDVTGHGLESGVLMLMAQTAVRTLLAVNETDPVKFMNALNQAIYANTRRMRTQKNMTLAILDYEEGRLRLSGQHEDLIVVRNDGTIEKFDTFDLGFPLGIESDITPFVSEISVHLQAGEMAVLYTDGITEAMNNQRQQYGLQRLYSVLQNHRHQPAKEIRQAVIDDVRLHIGNQKLMDDLTLLVLKQQ